MNSFINKMNSFNFFSSIRINIVCKLKDQMMKKFKLIKLLYNKIKFRLEIFKFYINN